MPKHVLPIKMLLVLCGAVMLCGCQAQGTEAGSDGSTGSESVTVSLPRGEDGILWDFVVKPKDALSLVSCSSDGDRQNRDSRQEFTFCGKKPGTVTIKFIPASGQDGKDAIKAFSYTYVYKVGDDLSVSLLSYHS